MAGGRHHLDDGCPLPQRLRNIAGVRQVMHAGSAIAARCRRIDAWMFNSGRHNLLFAALGLLFTILGLYQATSTRSLINTLTTRGTTTSATVTRVAHLERGRLEASVRFEVHGRQTSEDLALRPPNTIGEGQRVHVVYDPRDPSHVVLASQLNGDHATYGHILAALAGSATVACLGRWLYIRHRLRHPVTNRRYRVPWEPSPATRLTDRYMEDRKGP